MPEQVLNPATDSPKDLPHDAVELSRALLHASRELDDSAGSLARVASIASALRRVSLASLESDDARFAFWINVYNALSRHAIRVENARGNLLLRLGMFARAAYEIDGGRYSLGRLGSSSAPHAMEIPASGTRRGSSIRAFTSPSIAARNPARRFVRTSLR
jgi:hypothetical protein